jgi:hypothetical protein
MKYIATYIRPPQLFDKCRLRVNKISKEVDADSLTDAVKWATKIKIEGFMLLGVKTAL